jgi:hypothetical protein
VDARFDSSHVDSLIHRLGEEIARDPFYESEPWDQLALVIDLHRRTRMFGYVYAADDWEAASPDGLEPLETARRLQKAMRMENGALWRRCLVSIDRRTARIGIDFDYEGTRWAPDAADPERFALSLQPRAPSQKPPPDFSGSGF